MKTFCTSRLTVSVIISILTLHIFLDSCKKEPVSNNPESSNQTFNNNAQVRREVTKSKTTASDIEDWLIKQKGPEDLSPNRNKFIYAISKSLDFKNMKVDEWGDEEFIISIPIQEHISMHEEEKFLTSLVVFEDKSGSIRRGELAIVVNYNDPIQSTQVGLKDLYLNNDTGIEYNGKFKLVSFQDFEFAEKTFEGGRLKKYESYSGKHIGLGDNCIHWYWVHIEYNIGTGEIVDWDITDLGCMACPPNALCDQFNDDNEEDGGGGIQPAARTTNYTVAMFGEHSPPGYQDYHVNSGYAVTGIPNAANPGQSLFQNVVFRNSVALIWEPGAIINDIPTAYYYATIAVSTHAENFTAGTANPAVCTIQCVLTYPNQGNLTKAKSGDHTFTADVI